MTQILASDLSTIGVNLTLRPVDFATQFDTAVKRTYNGLLMSAGSNANLSDSTTPLITNKFWNPDVSQNFTGLDDPEYARIRDCAIERPRSDAGAEGQLPDGLAVGAIVRPRHVPLLE